jgi:hypothetical protein
MSFVEPAWTIQDVLNISLAAQSRPSYSNNSKPKADRLMIAGVILPPAFVKVPFFWLQERVTHILAPIGQNHLGNNRPVTDCATTNKREFPGFRQPPTSSTSAT